MRARKVAAYESESPLDQPQPTGKRSCTPLLYCLCSPPIGAEMSDISLQHDPAASNLAFEFLFETCSESIREKPQSSIVQE